MDCFTKVDLDEENSYLYGVRFTPLKALIAAFPKENILKEETVKVELDKSKPN